LLERCERRVGLCAKVGAEKALFGLWGVRGFALGGSFWWIAVWWCDAGGLGTETKGSETRLECGRGVCEWSRPRAAHFLGAGEASEDRSWRKEITRCLRSMALAN